MSTKEIEEGLSFNRTLDETKQLRADFMYDYLDFDNDRYAVRRRFIDEMHKKTTLKDIGEKIDKFIIDEKAEGFKHWDLSEIDDIKSSKKDFTSYEATWAGKILKE